MDFQIDLDPTHGVIRPTLMTSGRCPKRSSSITRARRTIDHESAAHRIKKPGRLLDKVLVVASCGMWDHDEVLHASQDSEEKANATGISLTPPQRCWYSSDLYTPQMRRILKHLPGNREGREKWFLRGPQGTASGGGDSPTIKWRAELAGPLFPGKIKSRRQKGRRLKGFSLHLRGSAGVPAICC